MGKLLGKKKDPIDIIYIHIIYIRIRTDYQIKIFPRKKSIPPFPSSLSEIKGTGKNASQHPQFIFARGNHSGLANSSQRHLTRNEGSVILSCIYICTHAFRWPTRERAHARKIKPCVVFPTSGRM